MKYDDTAFIRENISDFNKSWDIAKEITAIIDSSTARKVLINVLENWDFVNSESKSVWLDLIERAGFYPYFVQKTEQEVKYVQSIQSKIRTSYFKSEYLENIYFHEQQKEIELAITKGKNIAVSAPTSFGKSLFIEEIVARKIYNNILVIQPTLALIDETRRKMKKYNDFYNIIVNTKQEPMEYNVFILTAERVIEYKNLPQISFFIVDEFYKISNLRNDSRINALNVAMMKILESNPQSLFLTPTVDSISTKFIERYKVEFYKTDYKLVNTNIVEIRNTKGNVYSGTSKKVQLFTLLKSLNEPSIVYVKSPNEAYKLAIEYLDFLDEPMIINNQLEIFEWMDENISENWDLKKLLKFGIGAHNGALPRHIVTSEIDMFNEGKLKILFATVSLIEGVNTIAKNIIVYSRNKGDKLLDFFDFQNISGRAGRMGKYYSGNIYLFNEELKEEVFKIDVPFIDQDNISDEILFHINSEDIIDKKRKSELDYGLNEDLIKIIQNNLISVKGQKEMYEYISSNYLQLEYLKWKQIPTYNQLRDTLMLAYKFLDENQRFYSSDRDSLLALKLINDPLRKVILHEKIRLNENGAKDAENKAIGNILKFIRNDANFRIPKVLSVVDSIQKYVYMQNGMNTYGDYSFFSSYLENGQIDERLYFLNDFGIPSSGIKKISKVIPASIRADINVLAYIKNNFTIISKALLKYESKLLEKSLL